MNSGMRNLLIALSCIAALTAAGTAGYMLIEHMPLDDALYMTVITITTVGFEEVKPLDHAGRLFTMALIFTGVGTAYYVLAVVTEMVVGGQLREMLGRSAMARKIHQLEGHTIVCGYGRFGRVVAGELRRYGMTLAVIENDPEKEAALVREEVLYVLGSALDESTLDQAAIATASDIVIATASDPDNVFIALSARSKNPGIRVHARAESELGLKHLKLAGVDQAISSYHWSAMRIANAIARPSVVDFLNLLLPGAHPEEFSVEEVEVSPRSTLLGRTIAEIELENERIRVVAMKRNDEPMILIPEPRTQIRAGDLFVAIGPRPNLSQLADRIGR
ncbi:MAG TPA: potassium channel protein [Candidatus Binataceae bacterium]|nr:potassium channel protein [Candidatus Binataceae bacterium]